MAFELNTRGKSCAIDQLVTFLSVMYDLYTLAEGIMISVRSFKRSEGAFPTP